jgi:hypothetical protein
MSVKPGLLEHAVELFPPPERAFDRLVTLRDRRRRARQITAIAFTLLLLAAVVGAAVAVVRSSERRIPAEPPPLSVGRLEAVPITTLTGLTVSADGTIWWLEPGVSRFDPTTGSQLTLTLADDPLFEGAGPLSSASAGGVWVLVGDGTLRRFDGERFREVIPAPGVCDVREAPDGTLFGARCEDGPLVRWDGEAWVPLPDEGRPDAQAELEAFDASGALWVANDRSPGPEGMGVSRFDGTAWTTWTTRAGLPSDGVFAIDVAPSGDVWVGTRHGVARFSEGTWVAYPPSQTGIANVRSLVATDADVWIAGWNGDGADGDHVARFDGSAWAPATIGGEAGAGAPSQVQITRGAGSVWATENGVLYRLDGSNWRFVAGLGEGPSSIGPLAATGADEVWLGAWSDGLWRFDGGTWTHFGAPLPGRLPSDVVNGIVVTSDGAVWASTSAGLARFAGDGWEEVADGDHQTIALGPDGVPWTAREGPDGPIVGPVGGSPIPEPVPLVTVRTLGVVSDSDVWAGTGGYFNGLAHYDGSRWTPVTPVEGQPDFGVVDILVAPEGDVWVSLVFFGPERGYPGVVARFDGRGWTVYRDADGVALGTLDEGVIGGDLAISPGGVPLLASGSGLLEFRDGEWSLAQEGRFSRVSVTPDGTTWLAGDGLFRLPTT